MLSSRAAAASLCVLLVSRAWPTEACNGGYRMTLHSIENCAGAGQIITIDPTATVTLTKDCEVQAKGTVHVLGFQKAQMQVTITKNGLPVVKETVDLCASLEDAASSPDATAVIKMLGLPQHCPVDATDIVTDKSKGYSLERHKHNLLMAQGRSIIDVLIKHDNGESCFKIDMEVSNPKMLGG